MITIDRLANVISRESVLRSYQGSHASPSLRYRWNCSAHHDDMSDSAAYDADEDGVETSEVDICDRAGSNRNDTDEGEEQKTDYN